jgi:multiple sugar transport system permease protein
LSRHTKRAPARRAASDVWAGWALVLPALLVVGCFIVLPLLASVVISFTNYDLTHAGAAWIGLRNYFALLSRDGNSAGTFLAALRNSFFFGFTSVAIEFTVGFGLALLLNRTVRLSGMLRTLLVLPIMIAPTVSALQWRWILDPDNGILNHLALQFGFLDKPQLWLIQPAAAIWTVVLVDVWQTTPFVLLFLLAGLQSLPQEPYEAAKVDGASSLQLFWHLTLPLLRPVILAVLLLRFMDAFRIFDIVYVLTRGGPAYATDMVSLFTYRTGLQWFEIGKASAAGILTLAVIALCAALLLWLLGPGRRQEDA